MARRWASARYAGSRSHSTRRQRLRRECGFAPLPKRRVLERGSAWAARFRRLARDHERLEETVVGYLSWLVCPSVVMFCCSCAVSARLATRMN